MPNDVDDANVAIEASGIYGLWLAVTNLSVAELAKDPSRGAADFLYDPENEFFDLVSEGLGYDSDWLRNRIRQRYPGSRRWRRLDDLPLPPPVGRVAPPGCDLGHSGKCVSSDSA